MNPAKNFIKALKLSGSQTHLNLTVFPLLTEDIGRPDYLTLEQALKQKTVTITEVGEAGRVPELKLINSGESAVLIVEGEELVGAKQNRIVNVTFLAPGRTELIIPVSCVEAGRWTYHTPRFESGEKVMHASLRQKSQRAVEANLSQTRTFYSDQGMIWNEIAEKSARFNLNSPTGAMSDLFRQCQNRLEDYAKAFSLVEGQVGAVFAVNGQVLGLEAFGRQDTMSRFFSKLVQSYALDAIDWAGGQEEQPRVEAKNALDFLEAIQAAAYHEHDAIGLGRNLRLDSATVAGSALVLQDRLLHLSAFRKENEPDRSDLPYGRYSSRRRFRE